MTIIILDFSNLGLMQAAVENPQLMKPHTQFIQTYTRLFRYEILFHFTISIPFCEERQYSNQTECFPKVSYEFLNDLDGDKFVFLITIVMDFIFSSVFCNQVMVIMFCVIGCCTTLLQINAHTNKEITLANGCKGLRN